MGDPVSEYKGFIDGLVATRESLAARRVREGSWHRQRASDRLRFNELVGTLSPEQRDVISEILQGAVDEAIHDLLLFLSDQRYRLVRDGVGLAREPFGRGMHADFVARRNGEHWPDEPR